MDRIHRSKALFFPLMVLLALPACADPDTAPADSGFFEGRVLETGTNKPIPGAIVLGRWTEVRSVWPADSQDVCVHVETTTSDEDGRFKLPHYRGRNPTLFDSYKTDYEEAGYNLTEAYDRHESWLKRSTVGRGERLEYLERLEYATRCPSAGESAKNQLPLYRGFYDEASHLAVTKDDQKIVDGFLATIEIIELGHEAGVKRAIERAEKRNRKP